MWWGGRGQSFNIAPQKEEPEMGVRKGTGLVEGRGGQEGVSGDDVEIKEGRKASRTGGGCVSSAPADDGAWSVFYTVSSSSSHYPLTSPSLYCLPTLVLDSPQPRISVSPELPLSV